MNICIGIDTGGTYTDIVAFDLDSREVLAKGKSRTTKEELAIGISHALDLIPLELRKKARRVALSTTLATNACVEDKGGRAKLVLMGTTEQVLRRIDAPKAYGLRPEQVLCLDTKGSFDGTVVDQPDWDRVFDEHRAWFADAQAISLCEANAARNGAICERNGKEFLGKRLDVPFVLGCELSSDLNMMSRGATALLNARLMPIVADFMRSAVRALSSKGIDAPVMIVRNDGTLMGESLAIERPVETTLSGPAASVHGCRELIAPSDSLIVDIGGTTTDISLVKSGEPVMSSGIRIGSWQTQAKGVFIETFALGGDTAVRVENGSLRLGNGRVEPISAAAERWPELIPKLQALLDQPYRSPIPVWEVLYLVREPSPASNYGADELELVAMLRDGPCLLGDRVRIDPYTLVSERLEQEGIVMRAGLTPTDAMQVKGDFKRYDATAARLALRYVADLLHGEGARPRDIEEIADSIYDLVEARLYRNIVRILLRDRYPKAMGGGIPKSLDLVIEEEWDRCKRGGFAPLFDLDLHMQGTLIGIGAPTHLFLPHVAHALGTSCVVPEHAEVANAIGAAVASFGAQAMVQLDPKNSAGGVLGYLVRTEKGNLAFEDEDLAAAYERALEAGIEAAQRQAIEEARRRGAVGDLEVSVSWRRRTSDMPAGQIADLGTTIAARAMQRE